MTKSFKITSSAGIVFGIYEGVNEAAALDALAREAGYADYAEMQKDAGPEVAYFSDNELFIEEIHNDL